MKQTEFKKRGRAVGAQVLIGILIGAATVVLGAAVVAFMVSSSTIEAPAIKAAALILVAIGFFITTIVSSGEKEGAALRITAAAGILYVLLISANLIISGGQFDRTGITTLMALLGSAAAVGVKIARWKGAGKGKYKYHFR